MSYRDDVIAMARAQLNNMSIRNTVNTWFNSVNAYEAQNYGATKYTMTETSAWCAAFVSWCAAQVGILNGIQVYECDTQKMFLQYQASGRITTTPVHGDVAFIANAGNGNINHVAFVVGVMSDGLHTVEGNNYGGGDPNGVVETVWPYSHVVAYGSNNPDKRRWNGFLDDVSNTVIKGWAWYGCDNPSAKIHLYIRKNGSYVAQAIELLASMYRADLKSAGIGNGSHAFSYSTNLKNKYGAGTYQIEAYLINFQDNPQLNNSPKRIGVATTTVSAEAECQEENEQCIKRLLEKENSK